MAQFLNFNKLPVIKNEEPCGKTAWYLKYHIVHVITRPPIGVEGMLDRVIQKKEYGFPGQARE
jgi:hypothetical protein